MCVLNEKGSLFVHVQMLTGNFLATSGDAWLNGLDIKKHQMEVRSQLGYCPQVCPSIALLRWLTSCTCVGHNLAE